MGEGDHAFVVAGQRADGRTGKATLAPIVVKIASSPALRPAVENWKDISHP